MRALREVFGNAAALACVVSAAAGIATGEAVMLAACALYGGAAYVIKR